MLKTAPPHSLPLVVDFSMDDGRLHTDLRVYPILSDNKITNYQPRFLTEDEISLVEALLAEKSHWDAATRADLKPLKDDIGWYVDFSTRQ